jgi:hypothetical protein
MAMRLSLLCVGVLAIALAPARAATPIPWHWDEVTPVLFPAVDLVAVHGASSYRLSETGWRHKDQRRLTLSDGRWTITVVSDFGLQVNSVALLADDARIYVATYNVISSGCALAAFSASDGKQLWSVQLTAAGPVGHSKYFNRVQLREIDGKPVVFGNEAAARYIEVRDPTTGAAVSNTPLPAQMYPLPLGEPLYNELAARLASDATCELSGNDFLARGVSMPTADHATRFAAFSQAAAALKGVSLQHGAYNLALEVVDTKTDIRIKARRVLSAIRP